MRRPFATLFVLALAAGPAAAAQFSARETATYIGTGNNRTFASASAWYSDYITMPAGGDDVLGAVITLKSGQYDFATFYGGGTVRVFHDDVPAGATSATLDITNGGGGGAFAFQYQTRTGATFDESFITGGMVGGRRALLFRSGGTRLLDDGGTFTSTLGVSGDWTNPNNYVGLSWNPAYEVVSPWAYDRALGGTLITVRTTNYNQSQNPDLAITLFSSAVPEPATWATMIVGLGLTGTAARRRARCAAIPATA